MKQFLLLAFALTSLAHGFEIPKGSHHIGQLKDVVKTAAKAKQPIAFVITTKAMTAT